MQATGQGQEAHRRVVAVGYGEDLRDNLVPVTQESSLPEYREAQNSLPRQQPLPQLLEAPCVYVGEVL